MKTYCLVRFSDTALGRLPNDETVNSWSSFADLSRRTKSSDRGEIVQTRFFTRPRVKRATMPRRRDRRTARDAPGVSLIKTNERTNWLILCEWRIGPACMAFPLPRPPPSCFDWSLVSQTIMLCSSATAIAEYRRCSLHPCVNPDALSLAKIYFKHVAASFAAVLRQTFCKINISRKQILIFCEAYLPSVASTAIEAAQRRDTDSFYLSRENAAKAAFNVPRNSDTVFIADRRLEF